MRRSLVIAVVVLAALGIYFFANQPRTVIGQRVDHILVEKKKRRLVLLHGKYLVKEYRVALGALPSGAKEHEGDHRTPEGNYVIDFHKADSDYHRALHISYPNESDNGRAHRSGASRGGDIMIHGLPNGVGAIGAAHRLHDWTDGCIAVTDAEIEEIYAAVRDGTPIEIRP